MSKPNSTHLRELARLLATVLDAPNGLTQTEIAAKCGFDQGFVSRARNSSLTRETERTRTLKRALEVQYANMRKKIVTEPSSVRSAVGDYLAAGGSPDILVRQLELLKAAQKRTARAERDALRREKT